MTVNFSWNYCHAVKLSFRILPLIYYAVRSLRFWYRVVQIPHPQCPENNCKIIVWPDAEASVRVRSVEGHYFSWLLLLAPFESIVYILQDF